MKTLNYYIVLERLKDKEQKVAGLSISADTYKDERYFRGKVISVGPAGEGLIEEGDVIRYDKMAGHPMEHDGNQYTVIRIADAIIVE